MARRLLAVVTFAVVLAAAMGVARTPAASPACSPGFVSARLSWGHKCLRAGEYCKVKADREYHRYRFHCHTGRLSRSSAGKRTSSAGCEPGYSPCLPRVADLNCSDIPSSKKPIRVTGSDPYRLDGDGDGLACEP